MMPQDFEKNDEIGAPPLPRTYRSDKLVIKKQYKRLVASLLTFAVGFILTLAALPAAAHAATSGLCWVGGVQTARLSVSRWVQYDGLGNPYFRYHMDMNQGSYYVPYALFVNGVKQGGTNERYLNSYSSNKTIKGEWRWWKTVETQGQVFCSVVV